MYPSQDPAQVRAIVGASHRDIERVRELLTESPALAKAAWDWGFGDWETALGAASHTGRREIAVLLMEHGARPDLFTFAMLGRLEVVRACVEAQPGIQRLHGPHGITLLEHAQAGGPSAAAVVEYLEKLGDAGIGHVDLPVPAEWKDRYVGAYRAPTGQDEGFNILTIRDGRLAIRRGSDGAPRPLYFQGDHAFHPAGAPRVAIRFETGAQVVTELSIADGGRVLRFPRA